MNAQSLAITISLGGILLCAGDIPEIWIQQADRLMYQGKPCETAH